MVILAGLGAALAGLVLVYMVRERYRPTRLSAARFFDHLPPPEKEHSRLTWTRPRNAPSLWLRLAMLLLLLLAVLSELRPWEPQQRGMGVWLLIDSSQSMAARQGGATRMDQARALAAQVVARVRAVADHHCWRLGAFDLQARELAAAPTPEGMMQALESLQPRPLATDLSIPAALLAAEPPARPCDLTHAVVISDQAPPPLPQGLSLPLIWLDLGGPVADRGLAEPRLERDPLSGRTRLVRITVERRGGIGPGELELRAPDGELKRWPVQGGSGPRTLTFEPRLGGVHSLRLSPPDDYAGNDRMTLDVPMGQSPRVDWRLADATWRERLGWRHDPEQASLRVMDARQYLATADSLDGALLIVGAGYGGAQPSPVYRFVDGHPLLDALNLELAEDLGMARIDTPVGFAPLLADAAGHAYLVARESPPAIWVPGLPLDGEGAEQRFTTILFFNALRWLLAGRAATPEARWLAADGSAIEGAPEPPGDASVSEVAGALAELRPRDTRIPREPIWQWLVMGALVLLVLDVLMLLLLRGRWG